MSTYTITPASVFAQTGAKITSAYKAGEAIEIGDYVYLDESAQTWKKAECDGTAAASKCGGMALSKALAANQPITVCEKGLITLTISGGPAARAIMMLSGTAGKMFDTSDFNAASHYPCVLGIMKTSSVLDFDPQATGV